MSAMGASCVKPTVLLCVHQFFPQYSAGTEVLVLSTAKALRAVGYKVCIATGNITSSREMTADNYEFQGFQIHRFNIPHSPNGFDAETIIREYENPDVANLFSDVLSELKPDVVHFFHLKNLTLSCLKACFLRNIPTVFTPTDYWLSCRSCQLLKPWGKTECAGPERLAGNCLRHIVMNQQPARANIVRVLPSFVFTAVSLLTQFCFPKSSKFHRLSVDLRRRKTAIFQTLRKVDLLLPPTRSLDQLLIDGGVSREKIMPLRYAIDQPQVDYEVIAKSNAAAGTFVIGFIGTLVEHKGCHVLLQALRSLPHSGLEIRIYGHVEHYPAYVETLKALSENDPRVHFCGTFYPEGIGNVLAGLDVLVIPSTWRENAPLVLLNAIASGTPVIASNVTGITEYLNDRDDVVLFPSGNSTYLAEAIVKKLGAGSAQGNSSCKANRVAGTSLEGYVKALDDAYTHLIQRSHKIVEKI